MKNYLKIVLALVIFSFFISNVEAASNPYKKNLSWGGINCTWYAWDQAYNKAGVALPGWGNANTWLDYAKKAGYETGTVPRAKSIVVWQWSSYGHVGYVEKVNNDKIYVWDSEGPCLNEEYPPFKACMEEALMIDQHAQEECYSKYSEYIACEYNASYWHREGDLIGYIYLDNVPKKSVTSGTTNRNTGTNIPVKKSNNANLSSIKISNIDFEFKKEILEYNLEVENNIEAINIEATLEHNKAKVEGIGEQKLNIGENSIKLTVTAEDNTKKIYIIKIKRKDNNAYLNNLEINNIDMEFDKETLNYELKIARDIEKITVKGTAESSLATIEGLGDYYLLEEEKIIKIIVTAEDKTVKTYTITIKKEPIKESINEETKLNKKVNIWIVIGSCIAVISIITMLFVFVIKKRKSKKNQNNILD